MARRALAIAVGLLFVVPAGTASAAPPASCGLGSPEFTATGQFAASQQDSFVFVPFDVPAGHHPGAGQLLLRRPRRRATDDHTLDLGVYEPRPSGDTGPWGPAEFRGWGGSGYDRVNITPQGFPDDAHYAADRKAPVEGLTTRSFKPGPIPQGKWAVELGLANIAGAPRPRRAWAGEWRWTCRPRRRAARPTRRRPTTRARSSARPAGTRATSTPTPSTPATPTPRSPRPSTTASAPAGLDFITLSDHNTGTGWPEYDRRRADGGVPPGKLLVRSEEVTTYRGHTNNHASGVQPDYRVGPLFERASDGSLTQMRAARPVSQVFDEVNGANGITQVNHPTIFPSPPFPPGQCRGCQWRHTDDQTDYSKVDAIEVSTGIANSPFNATAIEFWESKLAQGHKIAAVGGSDSHRAGNTPGAFDAPLGTPTTMIYADELSEQGIRRAVEAGHTFVKVTGPSAPDLRLEARPRGAGGAAKIFGDSVCRRRAGGLHGAGAGRQRGEPAADHQERLAARDPAGHAAAASTPPSPPTDRAATGSS